MLPQVTAKIKWSVNGRTVAGGHGQGDASNQLHFPFGLHIDDDGSLVVADTDNHRIMRWEPNATQGEIMAVSKGTRNGNDRLNRPLAVLIDRRNDYLIVSEEGNRRVTRWPLNQSRQNGNEGAMILLKQCSFGLALDDEGSLYVSDFERGEVRRYSRRHGSEGVLVAGGHGRGAALNQLDSPRQIFVDGDRSIFVADSGNHRVVKWTKGAREGVVMAGGQGQGDGLGQLHRPSGIFVDRMGSVYVADQLNHRVMRWSNGAKEGEVVAGGNGQGSRSDQFNLPVGVSMDNQGNLYVIDCNNDRVQCFTLQ